MKISVACESPKYFPAIKNAGFDGIDFSDVLVENAITDSSYKQYAALLNNLADDYGIKYYQTHAPIIGMLSGEHGMDFAVDRIKRSIEFASLIGAEIAVIHPIKYSEFATDPEFVYEENMNYISKLIPACKDYGVKIAIENMRMSALDEKMKRDGVCADPTEFKKYIDSFDPSFVTGCLDLGHATLAKREPQDVLMDMGSKYITSLHFHDNDYVNDCHQLPCTMKMNWDEICKSIAEIGYTGHFNLEVISFIKTIEYDEIIPDAFNFMYKVSKRLVDKIEKYKTAQL